MTLLNTNEGNGLQIDQQCEILRRVFNQTLRSSVTRGTDKDIFKQYMDIQGRSGNLLYAFFKPTSLLNQFAVSDQIGKRNLIKALSANTEPCRPDTEQYPYKPLSRTIEVSDVNFPSDAMASGKSGSEATAPPGSELVEPGPYILIVADKDFIGKESGLPKIKELGLGGTSDPFYYFAYMALCQLKFQDFFSAKF